MYSPEVLFFLLSLSLLPQPVLTWSNVHDSLEILDHMAAVSISCCFADFSQIHIGKKQKLFYPGHSDLLNIVFAADSVDIPEFFCKPWIAESTVLGKILYSQAIMQMLLYISR